MAVKSVRDIETSPGTVLLLSKFVGKKLDTRTGHGRPEAARVLFDPI